MGICMYYGSVTHPLLSSPVFLTVSNHPITHSCVARRGRHVGSRTTKTAVHWGLPARTVYKGPDLLVEPDFGNGLRRQGREIQRIFTPSKPTSPSHGIFLQTTTRGLPCFIQREGNCCNMKPLEKMVQTSSHNQTGVWRCRERLPAAAGENGICNFL